MHDERYGVVSEHLVRIAFAAERYQVAHQRLLLLRLIRKGINQSITVLHLEILHAEIPRSENPQVYNGLHYEELVTENLFLQSRLADISNSPITPQSSFEPDFTVHEHVKTLFNATKENAQSSHVTKEADIRFPSRALSDALIDYAGDETVWNHFAIHVPTFREEHRQFWELNLSEAQRPWHDARWLSVYFSLLSVCAHVPTFVELLF